MNLRRMTLKYMGWCPGVDRAVYFLPDYDIPLSMRLLTVTLAIFLCFTFLAYAFYPPIPEGPLKITVSLGSRKQVIFDHEFNDSYDYGLLFGREWEHRVLVIFRERLRPSEFASGAEAEVEDLAFETLEEVCDYFREDVGAPNVVLGLTRYLLNQSFDETYSKIWGEPVSVTRRSFGHTIGDVDPLWHPRGVIYDVNVFRNNGEGVGVRKSNTLGEGRYERIWELRIDAVEIFMVDYYNMALENPRYEVRFIRYPRG